MTQTAAELYAAETTRNMYRFRFHLSTFKPAYWKAKSNPLASLKHELGIKDTDTTYDAELTTALG